ncbi:hypothetical protein TELCIR_06717 [Teladorsagia circumcincta]|uniref:Uncharacterized protein n=1 Tax=Teladorsagia circumcincta TaxID=45464 RepID=A0A2G9UMG2_TELCI|nr:hypothetical protein TELCIR_06717 [Teladorsagia circumcincta]
MISGGMVEGGGSGDVETTTFVTTADERLSFLRGISDDVIQKYYEASILPGFKVLPLNCSLIFLIIQENYENYEKVQEEKDQMLATERSHEVERIPSLNEVAKQTAELAQAIGTDDGLTETEKGAQVQGSVQTLPEEIKENLIMV